LTAHLLLVGLADSSSEADFPVVDSEIEAAVGGGADPSLVGDRRAFAAIVGKWNEGSLRALLTGRPLLRFHVPSRALGSAQPLPLVRIAEDVGEPVHSLEIGFSITWLGYQQPNLDQGVHDAPDILGAGDAPVGQHSLRQQAKLLQGKVPAGPGQLGT